MLTIAVHRKLTLCSCACWTVSGPWCPSSSDTRWIVERKQEGIMERCPCFIKTLRPAHWLIDSLVSYCAHSVYKQREVRNKSCVSLSNVLSAPFKSWGSRIKNCQKRRNRTDSWLKSVWNWCYFLRGQDAQAACAQPCCQQGQSALRCSVEITNSADIRSLGKNHKKKILSALAGKELN